MTEDEANGAVPPARADWRHDTFAQRQERLTRRTRHISLVGLSLAGFVIGLAASDTASAVYSQVPSWLRATVLTLIVVAGATLGSAYIRFDDRVHQIATSIERGTAGATDRIHDEWPEAAERLWLIALISTVLGPLMFLVAAWWATFAR